MEQCFQPIADGTTTMGGEYIDEQLNRGACLKATDEHSIELTHMLAPKDPSSKTVLDA